MSTAYDAATIAALSDDPRLVRIARARLEAEARHHMTENHGLLGPADTADLSRRASTTAPGAPVVDRPGVAEAATYSDAAPLVPVVESKGRIESERVTRPDGSTGTAHRDLDTGVVTYEWDNGTTSTSAYDHVLSKPTYETDEARLARGEVLG